jgi:hypothetical protein
VYDYWAEPDAKDEDMDMLDRYQKCLGPSGDWDGGVDQYDPSYVSDQDDDDENDDHHIDIKHDDAFSKKVANAQQRLRVWPSVDRQVRHEITCDYTRVGEPTTHFHSCIYCHYHHSQYPCVGWPQRGGEVKDYCQQGEDPFRALLEHAHIWSLTDDC